MRTGLLGWYGPDHRPWVDSLLLLGILVLTAEEGLFQWLHADGPLRPYRIVVAALSALSLLFARRHPAASAVLPVLTSSLFNRAFPGLFGVAPLASLGRTGPAVAAGAVIVLASAARADSLVGWAGTTGSQLLLQVAVLSFGLWLHGRRALIRALHAQVENLRRERELRAEQAWSAERARIAREMHDVLAHRLSLLVLHAGVAHPARARPGAGPVRPLVGLGERVGALGGHLDAGPDAVGGFRLSARLPAPDRPRPSRPTAARSESPGPRAPHPQPSQPPQPEDAA